MSLEYSKALRLGEKEYKRLVARGLSPFAPALDQLVPELDTLPRNYIGIHDIPLDMIIGTVTAARKSSFTPSFLPLLKEGTEFADKWAHVYNYQVSTGIDDAIKVYEYMRGFYVLEGNKRVSVMRYLDAPVITAEVFRVLPAEINDENHAVYREFLRFQKATGIFEIGFTQPGSYQELASLLGQDLGQPWPEDLAETLRLSYNHFLQLYERKDGLAMEMEPGDIFLAYLRYFPPETLVYDKDSALVQRFDMLRKEYRTESNLSDIQYVEAPEESATLSRKKAPSRLIDMLGKTFSGGYSAAKPLKIAFLHALDPRVSSRVRNHELGRTYLEEQFGAVIRTRAFYDCLSAEAESPFDVFDKAVGEAIEGGSKVIFTTSPALMPHVKIAALQHPEVRFLNCSVNLSHLAVRCYDSRMYEVKFMMGVLAAAYAENHQIGYLADTPTYGTIANINAFAIGATMADPFARVHVAWRSQQGVDWRRQMEEAGISVFSDVDFVAQEDESKPYGLYAFRQDGSLLPLARPLWNWGRYYELIAISLLQDTYDMPALDKKDRALNYWLGVSAGVVDILPDPDLPYSMKNMVNTLRTGLMSGGLAPFGGELHSQDGIIRREGGEPLTRQEILTMNWLNENVIGTIPETESLDPYAKSIAAVSGVK